MKSSQFRDTIAKLPDGHYTFSCLYIHGYSIKRLYWYGIVDNGSLTRLTSQLHHEDMYKTLPPDVWDEWKEEDFFLILPRYNENDKLKVGDRVKLRRRFL